MEVLSGTKLADRIKHVCTGPSPHKVAVAFWGPKMPSILFPEGLDGVEIILDVAMGGTSKDALMALGVPDNAFIRVCDGLHAKVYIGGNGAVVTSANASANALGPNLQGGRLEEVGVWLDANDDERAYNQAIKEFERLLTLSRPASAHDIERAPDHAFRSVTWRPPQERKSSFLALVAAEPDRFRDTLFIFGDMDLSDREKDLRETAVWPDHQETVKNDFAKLDDILTRVPGELSQLKRTEAHHYIVMYYWYGNNRIPTLHAYHAIQGSAPDEDGNTHFRGVDNWERFCRTHDIDGDLTNNVQVSNVDRTASLQLRGSGPKGERWKEYTAYELASSLDGVDD